MKPLRWLRRGLTLTTLGAVGGTAVITIRHLLATPQPLENRLFGDIAIDHRPEGDIYYNVAGPEDAEPFVLLHDFYPGASNFEYRRLYPRLAAEYRVYALDWLGFGLSERPALAYTGEFYARLLNGFLRDRLARPANVLAHGLAANVAVRAAADDPALFARLVLVEPRPLAGTLPGPTLPQTLVRGLQRASMGLVPYALLATRPALRWQLARHAAHRGEGAATDDALDHVFASAHQFGGHHALVARLTGELDLPIENALALLEPPVLIVTGAGDGQRSNAGLQDLALLNKGAETAAIAGAGESVHEDQPAALMEHLDSWLRTASRHPAATISETRASARFPAGAIRVDRGVEHAASETEATSGIPAPTAPPVTSTSVPPTPPASVARESAELQPPGANAQREVDPGDSGPNWSSEQFGEPHGLVSAHPHLDTLEGLAEQAPESAPVDEGLAGDMSTLAGEQHAREGTGPATQVTGKPMGEVETVLPSETVGTAEAPDSPAPGAASGAPTVTTPQRQPSESTTPPGPPPTTQRAAPASSSSIAPTSGGRSARSQPRPQSGEQRSKSAGTSRNVSGKGSKGSKSAGRAAGGTSSGTGTSGRKSPSHRPKKS